MILRTDRSVVEEIRKEAFRALLATGEPWDGERAELPGIDRQTVRAAGERLVAAGRARKDEQGRITAACGVSLDPTPHRMQTPFGPRWTNCAYDALGILGALEADGEIESRSPATGEPIHVRFERGRPTHSEAVLFLADQSCCSRPNEDWCPNVNLFEDESLAMARSYTGGLTHREESHAAALLVLLGGLLSVGGPVILKLIGRLVGDTVIEDVLVGSNAEGLRHAGTLRLLPVEWQMLNAVLGLGADRMDGDITVVIDGPSDIADSAKG